MNKKLIRLTESDLHKIVKESVNKVLNEGIADSVRIPVNGEVQNWVIRTNYDGYHQAQRKIRVVEENSGLASPWIILGEDGTIRFE